MSVSITLKQPCVETPTVSKVQYIVREDVRTGAGHPVTVWLITCATMRCKSTCERVEVVMRLGRVRCGTHATARAPFARGWSGG